MGTRTRIATVGAGVWLFALVAAILAFALPQALVDSLPATVVGAVASAVPFVIQ